MAQYKDGSAYVTNQGTSKSLKLQSALSAVLLALSIGAIVAGSESAVWALGAFVGLVWYLVIRAVTWWRHA